MEKPRNIHIAVVAMAALGASAATVDAQPVYAPPPAPPPVVMAPPAPRIMVAPPAPPPAPINPADPTLFKACDGYGAPNENGDGMTEMANGFLGLFVPEPASGNTSLATPVFTSRGIAACDAALANATRLLPIYHLRRANLLRARAIHKLSGGDTPGARADLDAADVEGALAKEPLYDRSMGLGSRFLRAYLALQAGRKDEVLTLVQQAQAMRPYVYRVQQTGSVLALVASRDGAAYYATLDRQAALYPEVRRSLMRIAADRMDWDKVITIRQMIDLTPPAPKQGGFLVQNYDWVVAGLFVDRIGLDELTAFALAASGKNAEAKALMAEIAQRLEPLNADLPKTAEGFQPPRLERYIHANLRPLLPRFKQGLEKTQTLIDQLAIARSGNQEAFQAAIKANPLPSDGRGLFLLRSLRDATTGPKAELDAQIAAGRNGLDTLAQTTKINLAALYGAMPAAETPARLPKYKTERNFLGEYPGNGFEIKQDGPVTKVNFGGVKAPEAVLEELALLKAAEITLAAGHDRFALLDKRITGRTMTQTGIYGGWTLPEGYVADLRIVPFDEGAPVKGYEAYAAKAVIAREVIAALGPVYQIDAAAPKP